MNVLSCYCVIFWVNSTVLLSLVLLRRVTSQTSQIVHTNPKLGTEWVPLATLAPLTRATTNHDKTWQRAQKEFR